MRTNQKEIKTKKINENRGKKQIIAIQNMKVLLFIIIIKKTLGQRVPNPGSQNLKANALHFTTRNQLAVCAIRELFIPLPQSLREAII